MATVRMGLASLDNTMNGRKHPDMPKSWNKKYAAYTVSAMANKQWPQARCAAARSAGWSKDPTCRLCNDAVGSHLHRHTCPVIWPQPQEQPPRDAYNHASASTPQQRDLWRTRGIGGTRIFVPARQEHPTIEWIREPDGNDPFDQLDWYVDASQSTLEWTLPRDSAWEQWLSTPMEI